MEITPSSTKRHFRPRLNVRFDNAQEVSDVASFGTLLPITTVASIRTFAIATSATVEYPVTVEYSARQVGDTGQELALMASQPEIAADPELSQRLTALSNMFRLAAENALPARR